MKMSRLLVVAFALALVLLNSSLAAAVVESLADDALRMKGHLADPDTWVLAAPASTGVEVRAGGSLWCPVPPDLRGRVLQFVVVNYRRDADGAKAPAWIGVRLQPESDRSETHRGVGPITWTDQFGPRKFVPVAPPNRPKQSTFLGCNDLLGNRPLAGAFIDNRADEGSSATMRVHRVDLVFLARGNRVAPERTATFAGAEQLNTLCWRHRLDTRVGRPLAPGESCEFVMPESGAFPYIAYIVLKHRKDPLLWPEGAADTAARDPNPAYMLVEVRDARTGLWRRWADRYGVAKYSEVRAPENPEDETLHNGLRTFGRVAADRVRVTNVGTGDPRLAVARVHELQVTFYPDVASACRREQIFTPETAFNAPERGVLIPLIGGGPRLEGRFPGAVPLGPGWRARLAAIGTLPASHTFPVTEEPPFPCRRDGLGRFVIPLPERGRLLMTEFAIGDLDVTTLQPNKDGFFGRAGRAELTVWLRNRAVPGRCFPAIVRNNIGMAGLIAIGAPPGAGPLQAGDELVAAVTGDVAFLMGYRVTWRVE